MLESRTISCIIICSAGSGGEKMNVEFKTTVREMFNCFFSTLSSMTEADFQYKLPILYCVPLTILCYSIIYLATRVQISDRLNDTIAISSRIHGRI